MEAINHEYYVSLEVAKLLKEAGFNWECSGHWVETNKNNEAALLALSPEPCLYDLSIVDADNSSLGCMCTIQDWNAAKDENGFQFYYSAPTLDVTQRWLRENYNIHILIDCIGRRNWLPTIQYMKGSEDIIVQDNAKPKMCSNYDGYDTYEEAQEAGIKKELEIILKN